MNYELREEIARALCTAAFHPDDAAHMFIKQAEAILPVIERACGEARDDFEDWLRGYDTTLADSYRYDRDNGRL